MIYFHLPDYTIVVVIIIILFILSLNEYAVKYRKRN